MIEPVATGSNLKQIFSQGTEITDDWLKKLAGDLEVKLSQGEDLNAEMQRLEKEAKGWKAQHDNLFPIEADLREAINRRYVKSWTNHGEKSKEAEALKKEIEYVSSHLAFYRQCHEHGYRRVSAKVLSWLRADHTPIFAPFTLDSDSCTLQVKTLGFDVSFVQRDSSGNTKWLPKVIYRMEKSTSCQPTLYYQILNSYFPQPLWEQYNDAAYWLYKKHGRLGYGNESGAWMSCRFSGYIPPATREKIKTAKTVFNPLYVYILAEVDEWVVRENRPIQQDPLVIGWNEFDPEHFYIIDAFDLLPMEEALALLAEKI